MERLFIYDAHVKYSDGGGEKFVLEVPAALRRGDRVECKNANYRVQYVVQARVYAALPLVLLIRED